MNASKCAAAGTNLCVPCRSHVCVWLYFLLFLKQPLSLRLMKGKRDHCKSPYGEATRINQPLCTLSLCQGGMQCLTLARGKIYYIESAMVCTFALTYTAKPIFPKINSQLRARVLFEILHLF